MPTSGTLNGVRVLELSRILSGPFAAMVLADLGADVIKVEDTRLGDDTRQWAPPWQGKESAYFLSVNRHKRGISVDLKSAEGSVIARQLAARADVVIENFRPGTAARLGLGYPQLSADNPGLIYASISGYGQTGPYADQAGYDAIVQAISGMMSVTGEAGGPPVRVGNSAADIVAGMWTVIGILAALHAREQSGRGQLIDISLLDGQVAALTYLASGYFASGVVPQRHGSAHPAIVPYQALDTADGQLMVAVGNDSLWQRFAAALGLRHLADDRRFTTNPERVRHRAILIPLLEAVLRTRGTAEWATILAEAGVPAGPINTIDVALAHPQLASREMVVEVDHLTEGRIRMLGSPIKLSEQPTTTGNAPPTLGEHTDAVLSELGYDRAAIDGLHARGVVR